MFSVIFEVLPNEGRKDEYLELAGNLKPILETIDGFLDVERYESKLRPGWILSQSTWRDEKSMVRWRTQRDHYFVQSKGRFEVFADYHLRIGEITADTDRDGSRCCETGDAYGSNAGEEQHFRAAGSAARSPRA